MTPGASAQFGVQGAAGPNGLGWQNQQRGYQTPGYGNHGYGTTGYGNHGYGRTGYGGYGAMNPLSAEAQLIVARSEAAINYEQAYNESIQNQKLRTETYYDDRRMNASYRAEQSMLHPHAPPEELAAFSRARLPPPLAPNEFDPARGVIEWPGVLNRPEFDEPRTRLAELFRQAAADPHGSGPGTRTNHEIEQTIEEMSEKLHSEIGQFKPNEYIAGSKFLKSLAYQAKTPAANALAMK